MNASGGILIGWALMLAAPLFFPSLHKACRTLVPQPGIEPTPPAVDAPSDNLRTTRKSSLLPFLLLVSTWEKWSTCNLLVPFVGKLNTFKSKFN